MFDADSPYAGKVTAYDSPIYIADAALYLMTTQPDLGITNPYALDQAQFDAAIELLSSRRRSSASTGRDYLKQMQAFKPAIRCWARPGRSPPTSSGRRPPVEVVKPEEGATGWSDTWMIASRRPNTNCSYLWMDHIISPEAKAQVAEYFGEAPANAKACDLTADETTATRSTPRTRPTGQTSTTGRRRPSECLDGRDRRRVPYAEWTRPGRAQGLTSRSWGAGPTGPPAQLHLDDDHRPRGPSSPAATHPPSHGPGRRSAVALHRHPGLRLAGLLARPCSWLVVAYLGALALLSHGVLDDRRLHRRGRPRVHPRQLQNLSRPRSTATSSLRTIGDRCAR